MRCASWSIQTTPIFEATLRIMAGIDALYLEGRCSGSRKIVDYLAKNGTPINRDRVRNLMRHIDIRVIDQESRATDPG